MEHRKEYGSPRDMLDDALLQRILADMTDDNTGPRPHCGCEQNGRSGRNTDRDDRTGCGCGRNRVMPRQEMQNNGCPAEGHCVSGGNTAQLKGFPLAMVYSPNQEWEGIFEPEEALSRGTLFTGLVFPWYPSKCRDSGCGCGRD